MRVLLLIIMLLGGIGGWAQRPVTEAWMLEGGTAHLADTYLTPLKYSGWHAGIDYSRMQTPRFGNGRLNMTLDAGVSLDCADSPARNATMWGAVLGLQWGLQRRWQLAALPGLTLYAGGTIGIEGGALYNARNGNNPVAAKGAVTLNLSALASWRTRVGGLPVTLSYRPTLPLIGAFFSPDYGELYYEIYLGNHSGLVHAAWPGSYFRLDHLLCADLHLWQCTALRLGYSGRIFSSKACGIVSRTFTHALTIGVTGTFTSVPSR